MIWKDKRRRLIADHSMKVYIPAISKEITVLPGVFIPNIGTYLATENISVSPGDNVLEFGTGCGILSLVAMLKKAAKITVIDINPAAIENARINFKNFGFNNNAGYRLLRFDNRKDLFSIINFEEKFDVMIFNPPWHKCRASSLLDCAHADPGLKVVKNFLKGAKNHLSTGGKIFLIYGHLRHLKYILKLARKDYNVREINQARRKSESIIKGASIFQLQPF